MRHGKKFNHLGKQTAHRHAMLSNMACSLIEHKRINTTIAKAKALRVFVEPIITKSKDDTTHARRTAFSYLKSKEAVSELFRSIAPRVADRPGGYTRIIRTGYRLGDNAEMCIIELVDFNELMLKDAAPAKKTTRRSRKPAGTVAAAPVAAPAAAKVVDEIPAAEVVEEAPVAEAEVVVETPAAEVETAPEETAAPEASADGDNEEK
jgi:large subunit ribosomal protein L17